MYKEAAVGERIAQWIRTPQVPGSRPGGNSTLSTELPTVYHHDKVERLLVYVEGRVLPNTLKWVAVYSSVTFHING